MSAFYTSRLICYGFWGSPDPNPVSIPLDPGAATLNYGLEIIRDRDGLTLKTRPKLRRAVETTDNLNSVAGYRTLQGPNLEDIVNPFGGNTPGVGFLYGTANLSNLYESTVFRVLADGAFSIRAFLEEPDKDQTLKLWFLRWGSYQFEILDGKASLKRFSSAWTQTQEAARVVLLKIESRTPTQDADLDALERLIYSTNESLDLGDGDYFYGPKGFSLDFIPDAAGSIDIEAGNGQRATVDIDALQTQLAQTRAPVTVWPSSSISVGGSGGLHFWQLSHLENAVASPRLEWLLPRPYDEIVDATPIFSANASAPSQVAFAHSDAGEGVSAALFKITATWSGNSTLYHEARFFVEGGARNGYNGVQWDSDDHPGIMMDVEIQEDTSRRRVATITLRDMSGMDVLSQAENMTHHFYHALENRVATLFIGGAAVMTKGIILQSEPKNLAEMTDNVVTSRVARANTQVVLTLCDKFGIIDESKVLAQPVGDGRAVADHAISLLKLPGLTDGDIAITPGTGGPLRGALPGEPYSEMPAFGAALGGALSDLQDRVGLGATFYERADGKIAFARPSSTVVAAFGTRTFANNPKTTEGRFKILAPLDWRRDFREFFNAFLAMGKNGISRLWTDNNSRFTQEVLNFLGRWKYADVIQDDSLSSAGDLERASRTARENGSLPGHLASFETYFHPTLRVFDRITIDGVFSRIESIGGASLRRDRMQILSRRLLA